MRRQYRSRKSGETLSHQELTDLVYDRISSNPRYEWVAKNLEYRENGVCGEFDVLAKVRGKEVYHHYEIKTWHCPKSDGKAREQFIRAKYYGYPSVDWQDIEVANGYVKRVRV